MDIQEWILKHSTQWWIVLQLINGLVPTWVTKLAAEGGEWMILSTQAMGAKICNLEKQDDSRRKTK